MSKSTYFVQECPTCGRRLEIRVEYLGRTVICQHCRGGLTAEDPPRSGPHIVPTSELLDRAEELIERADQRRSPDPA